MTSDLLQSVAAQHHAGKNDWLYQVDGMRKARIDITISSNGDWFHLGELIKRDSLVRLLEDSLIVVEGDCVLRAPEQLLRLKVEDQPFLITAISKSPSNLASEQPQYIAETSRGLRCVIGDEHPIELRPLPNQDLETPVVHIRDGLFGRLNRNCYYQLLDFCQANDGGEFILESSGAVFRIA